MSIKQWPIADRPREKLLSKGANVLSDAELLAIFLRTGIAGKSALDLARDLLTEFGDLNHLLAASQQRFCNAHGLGESKYAILQASLEMSRRQLQETLKAKHVFSCSEQTKAYVINQLFHLEQEAFGCMFLDIQYRLLGFEILFYGTINCTAVYPREVAKRALYHNASAVILAHNHPQGTSKPSTADITLTHRLQQGIALFDVKIADHIIVANNQSFSFAENGFLDMVETG